MPECENKACKWGPAGKPSQMPAPGMCVLCQDADATAASTGHRRGAVLRKLLAQPSSKQDSEFAHRGHKQKQNQNLNEGTISIYIHNKTKSCHNHISQPNQQP